MSNVVGAHGAVQPELESEKNLFNLNSTVWS